MQRPHASGVEAGLVRGHRQADAYIRQERNAGGQFLARDLPYRIPYHPGVVR